MAETEENDRVPRRGGTGPPGANGPPPLRLAVGLGDPERERELLPALGAGGDFIVAERCLAADQLLACLQSAQVDVALVASGLHRLNAGVLTELSRVRVPVVMLAAPGQEGSSRPFGAVVLPPEADAEAVRSALLSAVRGEQPRAVPHGEEHQAPRTEPGIWTQVPPTALSTLAVAGGHGSPGRTTVALNLAAALGAVAPTVLVDADLCGPSLAAYLDADPTRNIHMLAHADPGTPQEWEQALAEEMQPLSPRSPHAVVLCGVPRPQMHTGVSSRFFERLASELARRYRHVIIDVGADLLGPDVALHRTALGLAGQVLLVASADLVGLHHARVALGLFTGQMGIDPGRVALIINRHDRCYHHGRTEIEWALGVPAAAVIPYDHGPMQRAIAAQRPVVLEGRGPAARSLLELAERVNRGTIALPPEPGRNGHARGLKWPKVPRLGRTLRKGVVDGDGKGAAHGE